MTKRVFVNDKNHTVEWGTPTDLYNKLNEEFIFTLDAAASDCNHKASNYFTKEQNALIKPWSGRVFLNPPYGRRVSEWMNKAWSEVDIGNAELVVCLVPVCCDTAWFHRYCFGLAAEIRFIEGRLRFNNTSSGIDRGPAPHTAGFPACLVIFRDHEGPVKIRTSDRSGNVAGYTFL